MFFHRAVTITLKTSVQDRDRRMKQCFYHRAITIPLKTSVRTRDRRVKQSC